MRQQSNHSKIWHRIRDSNPCSRSENPSVLSSRRMRHILLFYNCNWFSSVCQSIFWCVMEELNHLARSTLNNAKSFTDPRVGHNAWENRLDRGAGFEPASTDSKSVILPVRRPPNNLYSYFTMFNNQTQKRLFKWYLMRESNSRFSRVKTEHYHYTNQA